MHRTEGNNNVNNLFTSGPPGTNLGENWLNAVQEEVCNTIEGAGLTLKTAATDTRNQLKEAIEILAPASTFASGTKMYFYQNIAPVGWTIDGATADALLAVKGGANAYNVAGGSQAGTWTQPNHIHGVGTYSVDGHTHAAGTYAGPSHTHGVGTYQSTAHSHNAGTLSVTNHSHELDDDGSTANSAGNIIIKNTTNGYLYDEAGITNLYPHCKYTTKTDGGGGGVSGQTANSIDSFLIGTSGAGGTGAVTGNSGSSTATISGSSANGATAATWRPLAQVGIICTKN